MIKINFNNRGNMKKTTCSFWSSSFIKHCQYSLGMEHRVEIAKVRACGNQKIVTINRNWNISVGDYIYVRKIDLFDDLKSEKKES